MKKIPRIILIVFLLAAIFYLVGPEPAMPQMNPDLPTVPSDPVLLEKMVQERESSPDIRPDNQGRIIWSNDTVKEMTDWALLYLHGFSASWYEGFPVHLDFAQQFGCNAYLPRLASHGLATDEALVDMTPDALWESAKEALMIARSLGRKVIVMGTSTGGTLALKLAAEYPNLVDGLVLYSPNVRINNGAAFLLSKPWGIHIARMVYKSNYRVTNEDFDSKECQYWYCKYRLEAVVYLQQLVEKTMKKEVFEKITCPTFLGYYYKDEVNQDQVVRVDAALAMFEQLGTTADNKAKSAFPDAGNHVITCELLSGSVDQVKEATSDFAENILQMQAK